ncbi:MAG: pilus assembly protein PilP [Myxococcota bacterium]|jgi:type IV pilus assembly protein PilP|nr:pilus assembly protein PilP [Myxococcota bacterium]
MRRRWIVVIGALLLAGSLVACEEDAAPTASSPSPPKARKAPPAPVETPKTTATDSAAADGEASGNDASSEENSGRYQAEGKRDPFRSFHLEQPEKPVVALGPLADFDLAQLVLVGVVWNTANPRALVADPGGRSFVLKKGSQIGKNGGRVTRIRDDTILVQEKFVDFEGNVTTRDVEMRIKKSQGG